MTESRIVDTVEAVEKLVDKHGLLHVVTALEIMCGEKADHIRSNWQDMETARPWRLAEGRLGKLAHQIESLNI